MRGCARSCSSVCLSILGLSFLASNGEAATAEETLANLNHLPPAERQANLVREAKKEGTVVWYAAMNREDLRQFTSGFEAEYPFLKVEVLTSGPQSLLNRILTEYRAGKYNYDILNIRSSALYMLKKASAAMRYDTPNRRALRAGFYDKEGYLNGLWASLLVYLFNTHQVSRAQAPKAVEDLLQPKWKGKLGMDKDADDWLAAVMDFYGDDKGKQLASGGPDDVGNRKTLIPDGDKWGSRYEELVQLTALLGR